jgi:hypothetical protein
MKKGSRRRPFPHAQVARLWQKGMKISEIAKRIGWVGKGDDPLHGLRVALTRMHAGCMNADGKKVKLPHRISKKALRLATKAGLKSVKKPIRQKKRIPANKPSDTAPTAALPTSV